ncbi:Molybdopterin synthase catalytic subunit [Perkinsus olseni]|uniref:Molybdopterin synthase catalytic subunit n=2 Tax=Perkinsus olseni TaxID=32597 RepID=A0A7J6R0S1_PEROL|nr:Molybdopterin synthase catalytic subunit [Perkinsus olseni]KAF4713981.1 Molybdopterin synthase catalytic subunit [Perkinsus olseni]
MDASSIHISLTHSPLDASASVDFVTAASGGRAGGISSFVGVTRRDEGSGKGERVEYLVYEAHTSMAEKKMLEIVTTLAAPERHPVLAVYAFHRLGRVNVGEASIIITAASVHRRAAIDFVSEAIDLLKAEVPVWKKEVYVSEEGERSSGLWKENAEWQPERLGSPAKPRS